MKQSILKFTMVEFLVAMVLVVFMMAFLMNAFSSAERLASTGHAEMTIVERSDMALTLIGSDLNGLTVTNSPRTQTSFEYTSQNCKFTTRLPLSSNPVTRHLVEYNYSGNSINRSVDGGTAEVLLDEVEDFSIEFFDDTSTAFLVSSPITVRPNYCRIRIRVSKPSSVPDTEDIERTFERRIDFQ